mgnify:CR=1 FL=1
MSFLRILCLVSLSFVTACHSGESTIDEKGTFSVARVDRLGLGLSAGQVLLTIDDGFKAQGPSNAADILEVLHRHGAKALFFPVTAALGKADKIGGEEGKLKVELHGDVPGSQTQAFLDVMRAGHCLANHSFTHSMAWDADRDPSGTRLREWTRADDLVAASLILDALEKQEPEAACVLQAFRLPGEKWSRQISAWLNETSKRVPELARLGGVIPGPIGKDMPGRVDSSSRYWEPIRAASASDPCPPNAERCAGRVEVTYFTLDEATRPGCESLPGGCQCAAAVEAALIPYKQGFWDMGKGIALTHSNSPCSVEFLEALLSFLDKEGATYVDPRQWLSSDAPLGLPSSDTAAFRNLDC